MVIYLKKIFIYRISIFKTSSFCVANERALEYLSNNFNKKILVRIKYLRDKYLN